MCKWDHVSGVLVSRRQPGQASPAQYGLAADALWRLASSGVLDTIAYLILSLLWRVEEQLSSPIAAGGGYTGWLTWIRSHTSFIVFWASISRLLLTCYSL